MSLKRSYKIPPGLLVLLGITVLNGLFFLPEYLFYRDSSSIFPSSSLTPDAIIGSLRQWFVRDSHDLFRCMGEFFILVLLTLGVHSWVKRKYVKKGFLIIYLLMLALTYYHVGSIKVYGEPPNYHNDFALVSEVLPIFFGELGLLTWTNLVLFLAGTMILLFLSNVFIGRWIDQLLGLRMGLKYIISTLIIVILIIFHYGIKWSFNKKNDQQSWKSLQWISPEFIQSIQKLPPIQLDTLIESYQNRTLDQTPNIYLLFVESYGSVVQLLKEEGPLYDQLIDSLSSDLRQGGFQVRSTYSHSPIIGGRSWLSFTSAMTGLSVESHVTFRELITKHYDYPHLIRWLKSKGYYTYRMKTMSNQTQSTASSYALMDRFYAFDEWKKFDDIPYSGVAYDYLGGIPDQYAINHFFHEVRDPDQNPYFLFFINTTSHAPWHPSPPLVEDWRTLDRRVADDRNRSLTLADESMRYFTSISYVLQAYVSFILDNLDENDLVILIGDHQPPAMTFLCEGIIDEYAVPLHIITQNETLLEQLESYSISFQKGMALSPFDDAVNMEHKDLFGLLVHLLAK